MSDYFPSEVIEEILRRLPIESLVKCTSVCKAWKSIITNDAFIISHHQHLKSNTANSSLFIHVQTFDDNDDGDVDRFLVKDDIYSFYSDDDATGSLSPFFNFPSLIWTSFDFDNWTVVGICNGLVCFAENLLSDYIQVVIWNPSIHKYIILPEPSITLTTHYYDVFYGFGFDSENNDYKVVRIVSSRDAEVTSQVEMYSFAAHSWRTITTESGVPFGFRIASIENKFVNGVLHWRAYCTVRGITEYFILTFDVVEETVGVMFVPRFLHKSPNKWGILTGGNQLAMMHMRPISVDSHYLEFRSVWVMREYGLVESWTILCDFVLTSNGYLLGVSALRNNGKVVLKTPNEGIDFRDPIKGLVKKIEQSFGSISFIGDYVDSLFLINDKNAKSDIPLRYIPIPSSWFSPSSDTDLES